MGKTHYIAMAGLHGYMPNSCDVYPTYDAAIDSLADLHELGEKRRRELRRNGSIELNLHRDGNEYAEVEECDCDEPGVHSDFPLDDDFWGDDEEEEED